MVYVQRGNLLQSSLFVTQFLLNMIRGDVFILTRCNISTQWKLTKQFNKIDVTRLPSVRLNLQISLITCLTYAKKKNRPDGALDQNKAQLSIGTAMHSGLEHRKKYRQKFSYPSNMTSRPKGQNQKWKCWLWGVQETRCHEIYTTGHRKASLFQPWWSVRCAIPTFDVNQCSLHGSMFCFCLLWLSLTAKGALAEHFETQIHGVIVCWWSLMSLSNSETCLTY